MFNWTVTAISVVTVTGIPMYCSHHVIKTSPACNVLLNSIPKCDFFVFFLFSSPCINKSLASTYIWMLSKRVAARCFVTCYSLPIPSGRCNMLQGERAAERHMSATPASLLRKIMWVQRNTRQERAHMVWHHTAPLTRWHSLLQKCAVSGVDRVGGKSSCSLDVAPVWVDKGCAGEAPWDLRSSDVNCIRKVERDSYPKS